MNTKFKERGQALILITLAAIGLFAFTGLAVDGSRTYSDRRHAQNAADAAALAAALTKIRGQDYVAAGLARASDNGYVTNENTAVEVKLCNEQKRDSNGSLVYDPSTGQPALIDCPGMPAGITTQQKAEYIRVRIKSTVNTTFARVFGWQTMKNTVQAVVRAQLPPPPAQPTSTSSHPTATDVVPYGSTSTPGSAPASTSVVTTGGADYGDAALIATRGGNSNQCFLMNGGADLYTHNSGIFINCSGSQAVFMNGNATLNMDTAGQVVGCYFTNGNANFDPITCAINGGVSLPINANTFTSVPRTQTPPTCSANGTVSGNVYSPGRFSNITINSGVTTIFNPGVYCISGNFNLNGNATMSGPVGRVQFVLQNQSINMNGGTIINFNDLEVYGANASFTLNGGAIFRAHRLRYFSTGNGNFTVNGNAEVTSADAYFYLAQGNLTWNGGSTLNLHGPVQGDPFGGLLLYKPWENNQRVTLNGGSNIHLTGTFMVPSSPVTFNGGVNFELHSKIVGYDYIVNGNADVDIYYLANENYNTSTIIASGGAATSVPPTPTSIKTSTPIPLPTSTPTATPGASIQLIQ
jgi:Flp pilus assembly protein TadG